MQHQQVPPARFYWTKELDLRLVHSIQAHLGSDVVTHHRKDGTRLSWEKILNELQCSPEGWPSSISSILDLRKRWDNNFRVWYAKAIPDGSEESKLRASMVSLSKLATLLSSRDYVEESRPGPKKGTKFSKRKRSKSGEELGEDDTSPFDRDAQASERFLSSEPLEKQKKGSALPVMTDVRLESWLSLLRDPQFQENFRIHTQSNIILEPKVLFDLFMGDVSFSNVPELARAMVSPEWSSRLCVEKDEKSVQALITSRRSFFVFPSKELRLDRRPLLFTLVLFGNQMPQCCNFLQALEGGEADEKLEATTLASKILDLPLPDDCQWWNKIMLAPLMGGVLDLLSSCVSALQQASVVDVTILQSLTLVKNQALGELLLKPGVYIRSVPVSFPVAYKSLTEVITSLGIRIPPWCLEIGPEKRQSLLDAMRHTANVAMHVIPLNIDSKQELVWNLKSDEKELCIIAEGNNQFGAVLRIQVSSDKHANISMLTSPMHFKMIRLNGRNYQDHVKISNGLCINFIIDRNVQVTLKIVNE